MEKIVINCLPEGNILNGNIYDYEIIKVLGQGSFGITYLAAAKLRSEMAAEDAVQYVAVKEFFMYEINGREKTAVTSGNKQGLYDKYKNKFIGEAQKLRSLKHEHIIQVLETFEENNTVYYSMEFLDGGSLDDYILSKGKLSEKETVEYILQIASALSFMHARNMLHLDLKPANIMMRDVNQLVLIDFGLSKQYDEKGIPESSTTIGGGTPGYAPIEQVNYHGDAYEGIPVTMDIYALGVTMYKMLTGCRPPEASVILNEGFPAYRLQENNVSKKMIAVITKAMAVTKKQRFQNVDAFVSYLTNEDTSFEIEEQTVNDSVNDDDFVQIINRLIASEQYKEAYNLCLECIKKKEHVSFASSKCDELIPLLKKKARKENRRQTFIITFVTIIVTVLSVLFAVFNQ